MNITEQEKFWDGEFGADYTLRNTRKQEEWDQFYIDTWGATKLAMLEKIIGNFDRDIKILEVGANTGMQLVGLQRMGFTNLYGVELQQHAVEISKTYGKNLNIIQGSGLDIPFKDGFFDLVFTSGVLIHVSPDDHKQFMSEMYRCSNSYLMGFEYYSDNVKSIDYRGNDGFLWKADFAGIMKGHFPGLTQVAHDLYPYVNEPGNQDAMYLFKK